MFSELSQILGRLGSADSFPRGNDWPVSPLTSAVMYGLSLIWMHLARNTTDWVSLGFLALSIVAEIYYLRGLKSRLMA